LGGYSIEIHFILLVQDAVRMDESAGIQLVTLWFVLLIFLETVSEGANPLISGAAFLAMLLVFAIPFLIVLLLASQFVEE
jgi:hypothetical protein